MAANRTQVELGVRQIFPPLDRFESLLINPGVNLFDLNRKSEHSLSLVIIRKRLLQHGRIHFCKLVRFSVDGGLATCL